MSADTLPPIHNPTMATVICDNGSHYDSPNLLLLFGQINLAKCAAERYAITSDPDGSSRFGREYDTARMWVGHAQIHLW